MQPNDETNNQPNSSNAPEQPSVEQSNQSSWTPQVVSPAGSSSADTEATTPVNVEPSSPTQDAAAPQLAPVAANNSPQPVAPQPTPVAGNPASPNMAPSSVSTAPPRKKRRLLWAVLVVVVVLVLAGGYTFAVYLPNTPDNVYKTSLNRDAQAYDSLVSYISNQQAKHYTGSVASGNFKFTSSSISADGTLQYKSDGVNSDGTANVDVAGNKININMRTVAVSGQSAPDMYVQVNGFKDILTNLGVTDPSITGLDGQWVVVDHTLLESFINRAKASANQTQAATGPTYTQVQDALKRVGTVNRQYLFTTDSKHAVLKKEKYLGKSTQDGRQVYGYQVGYDKSNLKDYVSALGSALNDSSLNSWVKDATGNSIADELDTTNINKSIDQADGSYTFNMYVDAKTKLVHKLHFADSHNPANSYLEAGLNYTGGDAIPVALTLHDKSDGSTTDGKILLTYNTKSGKVNVDANVNAGGSDGGNLTMNVDFTPSNDKIQVTAPAGAKPIMNVLQGLGLGDLLGTDTGSTTATQQPASSVFSLTN